MFGLMLTFARLTGEMHETAQLFRVSGRLAAVVPRLRSCRGGAACSQVPDDGPLWQLERHPGTGGIADLLSIVIWI